jgi:hypothetical protein
VDLELGRGRPAAGDEPLDLATFVSRSGAAGGVVPWPGGIWEVGEAEARLGLRGRGEGNGRERRAAIRFARSCQRPRRALAAEAVGSIFGLVGRWWLPAHQATSVPSPKNSEPLFRSKIFST